MGLCCHVRSAERCSAALSNLFSCEPSVRLCASSVVGIRATLVGFPRARLAGQWLPSMKRSWAWAEVCDVLSKLNILEWRVGGCASYLRGHQAKAEVSSAA
ncbi:hypothetical protein MAPG_06567 [Magnaporthiopsis poae ATCC 64411]|uniref:Uncharacterized protein n=1 Tax=Magnaporthiopsis poae (strain ATCC 64411 / 73-15) TaxID=644358 RepID=A0A0C4E2D3_MAGP6|nr:hypothetical protein MAPG_06567 [Magnaporthiopsis poae ATCC 64411]